MALDKSGHKAWWEVREFMGKTSQGCKVYKESFRNMVTGEMHRPANGWNGEPPCATGESVTLNQSSEPYRDNFDAIEWTPEPHGEVISEKTGKTIYKY